MALEKKQEDGRFCRAYLRTMDPEQAAAEIGRRDGYAMLGQKGTQQKLERMRCDAAAQLKMCCGSWHGWPLAGWMMR